MGYKAEAQIKVFLDDGGGSMVVSIATGRSTESIDDLALAIGAALVRQCRAVTGRDLDVAQKELATKNAEIKALQERVAELASAPPGQPQPMATADDVADEPRVRTRKK